MYKLTNDIKYIQQAIRYMDLFVKNENALIASKKTADTAMAAGDRNPPNAFAGDSYLEAGKYMEELALTYDYGYALLTAQQKADWEAYANQAIFNIWHPTTANWGGLNYPWSGWATNDPVNNYFYSFTKATMLWALATQNKTMISELQNNQFKLLVSFTSTLTGGGTREGTGYGTSLKSLFENYRYWKGSMTEDLSNITGHSKDTIDYWIHATVPTMNYFASIGDQARVSMPEMFDYQRVLMLEAVNLNKGTDQAARGAWWLNNIIILDDNTVGKVRYGFNARYDLLAAGQTPKAPTELVYMANGAGALFAISSWDTTASWFATIAGVYDQSHAHQDQGSFQFYKNEWLSITSNTLSNSGIEQTSDVHNVIRFMNGTIIIPQNNTSTGSALSYSDDGAVLKVNEDLTPAYSSNSTKILSWKRDFTFTRSKHQLNIHDKCSVANGITPVFQLHVPVLPVVNGNIITAGHLKITQTLPVVSGTNAPKIVKMPSSGYATNAYRIELTGSGCEFDVTLDAI